MRQSAVASSTILLAVCLLCSQAIAASTTYTCPVIADTRLDQRDPDSRFGTGTTMKIVGDPLGSEVVRSIVRFNIPPFIADDQIQSAVMYLYGKNGDDVDIYIHPVSRNWFEKDLYEEDNMTTQMIWGATWNQFGGDDDSLYPWNTAGGDYDNASSAEATIVDNWNAVNITTFLSDNLDAVRKYGMLMKMQDENLDEFRSVYSTDNTEYNPYLVLTVDLELPEGTHLCPALQDVYIDEREAYNFNFKTRLLVSWHPTYGTARGLWRFDIPTEIEESKIIDATMHLSGSEHALSTKSVDVDIYALNQPFDENTDTWSSLSNGGDYDNSSSATCHLPGDFNPEVTNWYAELDVTDLVGSNLNKVRDYGVLMKLSSEGSAKLHQNIASREACDETDVPGYLEIHVDVPPSIPFGPVRVDPMTFGLSDDPNSPTPVKAEQFAVGWMYEDDFGLCSETPSISGGFEYREYGAGTWEPLGTTHWPWISAFVVDFDSVTEPGPFECRAQITDCAGQIVYSPVGYVEIDQPPVFGFGPVRVDPMTYGLSRDSENPTLVENEAFAVGWVYYEDHVFCEDSPHIAGAWYYRQFGGEWIEGSPITHWTWMDAMVADFSGFADGQEFEFKAEMTDCAGQVVQTPVYYIAIEENL